MIPSLSKNKSYWFGTGSSKNLKIMSMDDENDLEKAQNRLARRGKILLREGHYPYEKMTTSFLFSDENSNEKSDENYEKKKEIYVVTEKVHGANFSFVTDGRQIEVASRRRILDPRRGDFFGCFGTGLVKRHEHLVLETFRRIQKTYGKDSMCTVWIFGELFGGGYPGKGSEENAELVQSGVFYTPTLEFIAFDICFSCDGETKTYIPYDDAFKLWEHELGGMFVRPLMRGDFTTCMQHPIEFDTTIPNRFGLPAVPKVEGFKKNRAEGVVVRIANQKETLSMSMETVTKLRGQRKMMKRKHSGFAEVAYGKVSRELKSFVNTSSSSSRSNMTRRKMGFEKKKGTTTRGEVIWYEIFARLTKARVDSAVSKTGSMPRISSSPARNSTHARMRQKLYENRVKQWTDEIFALVVEDLEEELSAELKSLTLNERGRLLSDARSIVEEILRDRKKML